MKNYPLESLLRTPVEWWSSMICLVAAVFVLNLPNHFLLMPNVSDGIAYGLMLLGLWRLCQGYRVFKYQRNLKRLPFYALSSDELPISHQKLFLGKGLGVFAFLKFLGFIRGS